MNYYEALGVSRNSEPEVIDAAYRALMKKYHPDLWQGDRTEVESRVRLINEAYATLRDPQRRRAYDKLHPPDTRRLAKRRPAPVQAAPNAWARQPVQRRPGYRRRKPPARWTSRHELAGRPIMLATMICALLGVVAIVAFGPGRPSRAQLTDQSLVLPLANASLLSGGRKQTFCITNKTLSPVDYTLYWGGTEARRYTVEPGYYVMHSSAYSAAPIIKFYDDVAGEAAVSVVNATMTSGMPKLCEPNYSFENKVADSPLTPAGGRFGLYRDRPAELSRAERAPAKS